jgi:hypothetical protein
MPSPSDNQITFLARIIPPAPDAGGVLQTHSRQRRGQTAIIALLVLLLLAFVGGLFVTIVANNLRTQGRSHRTLTADYYAEAGLRYADDQLTHSLDGADWRPPLQAQLDAGDIPTGTAALARYNAIKSGLTNLNAAPYLNDPDKLYLQQGFSRYDTEGGRFLLRVTYDPQAATTHYLKIESVGREGIVDQTDPTTYQNQPATRLAATLIAYKPIAITDYARFETNKDNRSGAIDLGVPSAYRPNPGNGDPTPSGIVTPGVFDFVGSDSAPTLQQFPITTTYGNAASGNGGSFRANGSVRFYGINDFYLNRPATGGNGEDIEIAGNLFLDNYQPTQDTGNSTTSPYAGLQDQDAAVIINPQTITAPSTTPFYAGPTTSSVRPFDTNQGAVRDGGSGADSSDASGNARSIARLEPPLIDNVNSATRLTRYQDITENSPERLFPTLNGTTDADAPPATLDPTAGQDGMGQAIYVNNTGDTQSDSTSLVGGHTLVDEWLHRNGGGSSDTNAKGGWDGPFYNPPGVDVTFGLQQEDIGGTNYSFYGVRLTRSDVDSSGNPVLWKSPDGTPGTSPTLVVSYNDLNASNDPATVPQAGTAAYNAYQANPNNDVVIYCEGNVRIKPSLISAMSGETVAAGEPKRLYTINNGNQTSDDVLPRHITIVTNGTAYIEGSILKGNTDSSMTILARNYVCLNTTQFYAGAIADQNAQSTQMPSASLSDGSLLDFSAQNDVLVQDFNFNTDYNPNTANPTGAYGVPNGPFALYLSGGPSAPGETQAQIDVIDPATGQEIASNPASPTTDPFDYPLLQPTFDTLGNASNGASSLTHISFDLSANASLEALPTTPFLPLQLWTRLSPNTVPIGGTVAVATQDYVQERSAILPMDIQIDAVMYAQDNSFFVIPGPWFNSDANDNLSSYATTGDRNNQSTAQIAPGLARFPFYGQPVDLRITIDGSVSENLPPPISAQAEWMAKWGWIPQYHGGEATYTGDTSPGFENSGHPSATAKQPSFGLNFVYDPMAGTPYDNGYIRTDLYGRPLPFTPKLPVSTGLIYAGQSDPQSLLQ